MHAVTYFAPEARAALDDLGYPGFWVGYFAARSAPLGKVPAEAVTATFYNFAPNGSQGAAQGLGGRRAEGPCSRVTNRGSRAAPLRRR